MRAFCRQGGKAIWLLFSLNQQGLTAVLVIHELDSAEHTSRQITFRDGRLVKDELVAHPRDVQAQWATSANQNPYEDFDSES
jgi:ABC-type lipoprotein export system ATPase subunit